MKRYAVQVDRDLNDFYYEIQYVYAIDLIAALEIAFKAFRGHHISGIEESPESR